MSYVMPFLPTILVKFVTVRSASPYGTAVGPLGTGGNDAGNTTFIVRSHANIKDLGSIIMLSFPRRSLVQDSGPLPLPGFRHRCEIGGWIKRTPETLNHAVNGG